MGNGPFRSLIYRTFGGLSQASSSQTSRSCLGWTCRLKAISNNWLICSIKIPSETWLYLAGDGKNPLLLRSISNHASIAYVIHHMSNEYTIIWVFYRDFHHAVNRDWLVKPPIPEISMGKESMGWETCHFTEQQNSTVLFWLYRMHIGKLQPQK